MPLTVVLELEWVLRSRYGCDQPGVLDALSALLETREVAFHDEDVLEEALALYRASRADFAECLHVGIALRHGRLPFHTFDRSAATLPGTALVRP